MADDVVDLTLKYFEIGSMIAMVLFGMSTIQVYMYFSACQNDPKRIKVFVVCLWLLELAHTSLSGYSIVSSTITYNDKSMKLAHLNRLSVSSGMIANTITSCAQIWFAYRLLKLSQLKIYPYICMFLPGVKFVSFYALTIYKIVTSKSLKYLLVLPSIAACAGDLLTAGGLIWCLRKRNRGDTFSQRCPTDRLLVWCLETNLLTSVSVLVAFVFFEISMSVKVNYIWLTLSLVNCRLYSMCLFASLIAKDRLERERPLMYSLGSELAIGMSDQSPLTILASSPSSAPTSRG